MSPLFVSAASVQSYNANAQVVVMQGPLRGQDFGLDSGTRDKSGMYDEEMGKARAEEITVIV